MTEHPQHIAWEDHAEAMASLRTELTAECMRLEAVIDERNRQIEALEERLPASAGARPARLPLAEREPPKASASPSEDRELAASAVPHADATRSSRRWEAPAR